MVSTDDYVILVVSVIAVVAVVLVTFSYLRNYRLRHLRELQQSGSNPDHAGDRAYNRLAIARREADLLEAQGGDVEQARQLINLSSASLNRREYSRAYDLAQSAHETLVRARREPKRPQPSETTTPAAPAETGAAAPLPVGGPSAPPNAAPALARNRAEAQFQLRLFESELARQPKKRSDGPNVTEARAIYVEAQAAYTRGEYSQAFRLSLKGRRRLGAHVESLGAPASGPVGTVAGPAPVAGADAAQAAEQFAGQDRCPTCGHPAQPGDAFCRGCGAVRSPTACPKCGAARTPADAFCGKCGFRYDRPTG